MTAMHKLPIVTGTRPQSFDETARLIAEIIDDVLVIPRARQRRLEIITHHVKRAILHGYKAGRAREAT